MDQLRNIVRDPIKYQKIKATEKEVLTFSTEEATNNTLTTSKAGGIGYFPRFLPYPKNTNGQPLTLLAQLNFEELPHLENYPTTGILAFYVDDFDDLIGLELEKRAANTLPGYRVFYFKDTQAEAYSKETITQYFDAFSEEERYTIVEHEVKLTGTIEKRLLLSSSYDFNAYYKQDFYAYFDENEDLLDQLYETFYTGGTIMGGYPFFTQEDPRMYSEHVTQTEVLFQLDSDFDNIMWGDAGVANFFISKEDLANLNFQNVLYNWDCY